MKTVKYLLVVACALSLLTMSGCLISRIAKPDDDDQDVEPTVLLFDDFNSGAIDDEIWSATIDSIKFEDDGKSGKWVHLVGDGAISGLVTQQTFEPSYVLEFDYMLPINESGEYATVIFHPNGINNCYYWLDMGTSNLVGVYTYDSNAESAWTCRWIATTTIEPDTLYKFKIENEPTRVRIIIAGQNGTELDNSDWLSHDNGNEEHIAFQAKGYEDLRGAIFDNIKITSSNL